MTTPSLPPSSPSLGLSGLCFTPFLALRLSLVHRLSFAPFHFLMLPHTVPSSWNPPSAEPGRVLAAASWGVLEPASIAPPTLAPREVSDLPARFPRGLLLFLCGVEVVWMSGLPCLCAETLLPPLSMDVPVLRRLSPSSFLRHLSPSISHDSISPLFGKASWCPPPSWSALLLCPHLFSF